MNESGQRTMTIGYLGPRGTFTNEAARKFTLKNEKATGEEGEATLTPYRAIPDILHDVEQGKIDYGVVPIENSTEGSVNVTLDALVHDVEVQIDAELVLPIRHHLFAKAGVKVDEIKMVYSHPQALAQCRKSIERLLPNAVVVAATSTAEAAERIANESVDGSKAAIGTELAGLLYGLDMVAADLQDFQHNATRFIRVGRALGKRSGFDKTSIVFAFGSDKPGNLYRVLKVFADDGINLTKLESRPAKRSLGDYIFFVDMEGYVTDGRVAKALEAIEQQSAFFKFLGSYPRVEHKRTNGSGI